MKPKYILIILLIGFAVDMIGVWMKITHQMHGDTIKTVGLVIKLVAIVLFVIKLIQTKSLHTFLREE